MGTFLAPVPAYEVERWQIEQTLNLGALVNLTDHDSIAAPTQLRVPQPCPSAAPSFTSASIRCPGP